MSHARVVTALALAFGATCPEGFVVWWSATVAWFARYGGIPIADGKLP